MISRDRSGIDADTGIKESEGYPDINTSCDINLSQVSTNLRSSANDTSDYSASPWRAPFYAVTEDEEVNSNSERSTLYTPRHNEISAPREAKRMRVISSDDQDFDTGSPEAEYGDNNPRYWKAHHQDLYSSKWYKALLWLILAAITSASVLVVIFFASGIDVFDYDGLYFWLFCITPLAGVVFVWVPGGVFFSKVFRPI